MLRAWRKDFKNFRGARDDSSVAWVVPGELAPRVAEVFAEEGGLVVRLRKVAEKVELGEAVFETEGQESRSTEVLESQGFFD